MRLCRWLNMTPLSYAPSSLWGDMKLYREAAERCGALDFLEPEAVLSHEADIASPNRSGAHI